MPKVLTVEKVSIHAVQTKTESIVIWALGTVPTSGWKDAQLSPYYYINPPEDGIYDFDLVATSPGGVTLQVISTVAATLTIPSMPSWLKGVRVHASVNSMVAMLSDTKPIEIKGGGISALWDGNLPWPDIFRVSMGFDVGNG